MSQDERIKLSCEGLDNIWDGGAFQYILFQYAKHGKDPDLLLQLALASILTYGLRKSMSPQEVTDFIKNGWQHTITCTGWKEMLFKFDKDHRQNENEDD